MTLTVTIRADNAAFDEPGPELARILREIADTVEHRADIHGSHCYDVNGNHVGTWKFEADKPAPESWTPEQILAREG
jgi:hypothetical protein